MVELPFKGETQVPQCPKEEFLTTILLVDDEPLIIDSLTYSLKREGFTVKAVSEGRLVLPAVEKERPDLIILDIMLPDISGIEVCRQIRQVSTTPVIMLTARGEELDRVAGLEVGADDYLAKPFSFKELMARIRSTLRRVELDRQANQPHYLTLHNLRLEPGAHRVLRDGDELPLSAREYALLSVLMHNAGRALSREELLRQVWGPGWSGDPRTLDVHIRWLRMKIEDDPASPRLIQTARGYGYRFAAQEELI